MSYVPPGWPEQVQPPGSDGFERTAIGWLFDQSPPDFRAYDVLRRHPALLARLALEQIGAAVTGCRDGYRTARADVRALDLDAGVLEELLAAYEREGRRLALAQRAAELVGQALRGEAFVQPL